MNRMPRKYFMSFILLSFLLVFLPICSATNEENGAKLMEMSKKDILSKELQYLKSQPLSHDLRSFIKRVKRKIKEKRQKDVDKDSMYVVQNGEIIPLNSVEKKAEEDEKPVRENFTVIPLIIPVSVPRDNPNISSTESAVSRSNREYKFNIIDECETTKEDLIIKNKLDSIEPTKTTERERTEETESTSKGGSSKSIDPKLIDKILQDVEQLAKGENETKTTTESPICKVNGDWDSIAGGMEFRIDVRNDSHHPDIQLSEREPPMEEGFMKGQNWTVTALVPFSRASILVLNAYTNKGKRIAAVFTGECRVCDGEESIVGNWLIQRHSKDCKDREVAHKFLSDVFKKNSVRHLQQVHLHVLENSTKSST